jgi:hypothetical protein
LSGLAGRDRTPQATAVIGAAGSFAAISTLLGSPLLGAFLLMEASGLGGPTLGLVLVPGLVAAGVGSLVFIGLDSWTGLGTFSLALPDLPHVGHRPSPSSPGRWSSASSPPRWAPPFAGSPCGFGLTSSGACFWPRPWPAWPSLAWRSCTPGPAAMTSPTCCSPARTSSVPW